MTRVCFILGIMPRSGTNFLENQLILHSDCEAPGPIWEDFLISSTPLLEKLKRKLGSRWDDYWFRNTEIDFLHKLGLDIGQSLTNFLLDQTKNSNAEYLITKTPTVLGLENYKLYFPNSKLIVIVRDGRDVVESGVKSFHWDLVKALFDWKINAKKIIGFMNNNANSALLVKFEDLFNNPEQAMSNILKYLELDKENYPFNKLKDMPVSGSSTLKAEQGEINWKSVKKDQDFYPIARYKNWSAWKKYLSIIIAGDELRIMGYDICEKPSFLEKLQAYLFLIIWPAQVIPRTFYYLLKKKIFVLKTN